MVVLYTVIESLSTLFLFRFRYFFRVRGRVTAGGLAGAMASDSPCGPEAGLRQGLCVRVGPQEALGGPGEGTGAAGP